ncbi:MAG TPA: carboxylating nicotinate-nucleotide diphosphorylase [Elusimicrobia bacterium]|nr:MAG: nicotinate-nucleotide diphosphorylase (carboxylating) [Elusimicrobia bacterium GWF2_62_30]HBA60316.1 carboxylating nicotinate-nucleotide diphosphorylase [Elusimicrobiota bacterium]
MKEFDTVIKAALKEDIGSGDVTTRFFVPLGTRFRGKMLAKDNGVLCGLDVAKRVLELAAPGSKIKTRYKDGARINKGDIVMEVEGPATILTAERTALNFLQHMSGVATRAALFSAVIKSSRTKIYDTRKTLPGLRAIEKYAAGVGGARNHRMGLYDMAMIKDNHVALAGGRPEVLAERIKAMRKAKPGLKIEIEVQSLAQLKAFLPLGADVIMLDNIAYRDMMDAMAMIRSYKGKKPEVEISGGVDLEKAAKFASLGVDRISVGSITSAARPLDISFEVEEK